MCRLVLQRLMGGLVVLGLLSACSYRPLYGKHENGADVAAIIQSMDISPQASRGGQIVRNELISAFGGEAPSPKYGLRLTVSEKKGSVSSLRSSVVDRWRYTVTGAYVVVEISSGAVLTRGKAIGAVSYDTVVEPIADEQAREAARQRAARLVAEEIKLRISAFFATVR